MSEKFYVVGPRGGRGKTAFRTARAAQRYAETIEGRVMHHGEVLWPTADPWRVALWNLVVEG